MRWIYRMAFGHRQTTYKGSKAWMLIQMDYDEKIKNHFTHTKVQPSHADRLRHLIICHIPFFLHCSLILTKLNQITMYNGWMVFSSMQVSRIRPNLPPDYARIPLSSRSNSKLRQNTNAFAATAFIFIWIGSPFGWLTRDYISISYFECLPNPSWGIDA